MDTTSSVIRKSLTELYTNTKQQEYHRSMTKWERVKFHFPFSTQKTDYLKYMTKTKFTIEMMEIGLSIGSGVLIDIINPEGLVRKAINRWYYTPQLFKSLTGNLLFIYKDIWSSEHQGLSERARLRLQGLMNRFEIRDSAKHLRKWVDSAYKNQCEDPFDLPSNFATTNQGRAVCMHDLLKRNGIKGKK